MKYKRYHNAVEKVTSWKDFPVLFKDGVIIGSNSIIAAGAVLTKNTIVEPGSIYAGIPAKKVKDVSEALIAGEIDRIANNYVKYSSWFHD